MRIVALCVAIFIIVSGFGLAWHTADADGSRHSDGVDDFTERVLDARCDVDPTLDECQPTAPEHKPVPMSEGDWGESYRTSWYCKYGVGGDLRGTGFEPHDWHHHIYEGYYTWRTCTQITWMRTVDGIYVIDVR